MEAAAESDHDDEADASELGVTEPLSRVFQVGRLVRCVITSLSRGEQQKRIELSTNPTLVNAGITAAEVEKGAVSIICCRCSFCSASHWLYPYCCLSVLLYAPAASVVCG